jgi:hypothetical protein
VRHTCAATEPDLAGPHPERCPATTRYVRPWTGIAVGIQCKHGRGHDGDHAGYAGYGYGDVFWPAAREATDAPA